jgi:hypothetical protein
MIMIMTTMMIMNDNDDVDDDDTDSDATNFNSGIYALHVAILKCDLVVIKKFFKVLKGTSHDHRDFMDFFQRKSLHYFCERADCRVDILEYLLKKESDVNHADINVWILNYLIF